MLDVGWTEMLVIAIVMIVVVGPKDLPNMLRTMGRMTAKLRGMAGDFQRQFNEALKEAELDDVKKSVDALRDLNPMSQIRKQLNPFEQAASDVRSGLDDVMKPKPAAPAVEGDEAQPAEPLKAGATAMPAASAGAVPAASPAPVAVQGVVAQPAAGKGRAKPVKAASAKAGSAKAAPVKASPAKTPVKAASALAKSAAPKAAANAAPAKTASARSTKAPAAKATGKRTAK